MNVIDWVVIVIIVLYGLNGLYRGFMPSVLNLGGFFISWVTAFLTYPLLAKPLSQTDLFSQLKFYIEGSERINNYELVNLDVSKITPTQLTDIMGNAKVPFPFDKAIETNVKTLAFQDQGVTTLGDYFNNTIYYVIVNIIALIIIFVVIRILLTLLTNAFIYSTVTPQLRHFDYLFGAGLGLLRGYFSMHIIFLGVPILLVLFSTISLITDTIGDAGATNLFYSGSLILRFVVGHG